MLIVGSHPDKEEDLAGEPFVGKKGKLLDAMLKDAGFDLMALRFTSAVRCSTPDNRVPLPAEILACSDHLKAEIAAVQPDVIIALGEVALKALCGVRTPIAAARGKSFPLHERFEHPCDVWVTYSPGYVLGSPMARSTIVTDLRRVRDRALQQPEQTWTPWTDVAELGDVVAYDVETYDREGNITDRPTQAAVSDGERTYVTINHQASMYERIRRASIIVTHNGWKFDDEKTGVPSHYDTMVMAYLLDETQPLNLEYLCVKYLGVRGWKEARDDAKLGTIELADYNARDAYYTIRLFYKLRELLGEARMRIIDYVIRPARRALDKATERGIYIDAAAVAIEKAKAEKLIEERRAAVIEEVRKAGFPDDYFNKQLKTKIKEVPFNPGSNDHVGAVFEWLGFKLPLTKDGKSSVDKQTLVFIDHPLSAAILEYRETTKRKSTYIDPYEEFTKSDDGRAHSIFETTKTVTGRSSSHGAKDGKWKGRGTNSQNLDRELKKFKAPAPGKVLVSADYAAVEFRMGAFIADERVIIENYQRDANWDPHTFFACRLYNETEETIKAEAARDKANSRRQIAKSANFSQEYLGKGETLRNYAAREMGMFLTHQQSDEAHNGWHRTFPGWKRWYIRTKQEWLKNYKETGTGFVEDPIGWRRNFGDLSLLTGKQKADALRELCNFKVQGFCARIAYIALGACDAAGLPIVDFVHDDIKFEFDSMEQAQAAEPLIRRCMIDEPLRVLREIFGVIPTVPLEVEVVYQEAKGQLPAVQQAA